MDRESYNDYLREFDALMNHLNYPSRAREAKSAVDRGMRAEEVACYLSISVEELEQDLVTLRAIQQLTDKFNQEGNGA